MPNSKPVVMDNHPGRNSQTYGIARELGTDMDLIHTPAIGVIGNKGDSQCYLGVQTKVEAIHLGLFRARSDPLDGVARIDLFGGVDVGFGDGGEGGGGGLFNVCIVVLNVWSCCWMELMIVLYFLSIEIE